MSGVGCLIALHGSARGRWEMRGGTPADQFAAIHGLFWLCANRPERGPLVVLVADVQWAGDRSLAWLGYLARRVGDLRLVMVLGLGSGDPGSGRAELPQLTGDTVAERIAVAPLSVAAVGTLVPPWSARSRSRIC